MRSLLPFPARALRRGLGVLLMAAAGGTTGCSWITGVPDVTSVDLGVDNRTIAAGSTSLAVCTIYGKGNSVVHSTRVICGFSSSNSAIATVNGTTGVIAGVAPGTAVITASARGHTDTVTVTVTDAPPARIDITVPALYLQEACQAVDIRLIDKNGQQLAARTAQVNVSNPSIATVQNAGTTAGVKLCAVTQGSTTMTVTVSGVSQLANVVVAPARVGKAQASLAGGSNTIVENQVASTAVVLFAGDQTTVLSNAGQQFTYTVDDPTIVSVNGAGIVTGLKPGSTTVRVGIAGSPVTTSFVVTVNPIRAAEVRVTNRGPFVRLSSTGTAVTSLRPAAAFDSLGRAIVNRQIIYKSSDPTIFTVNSIGTVTALKLGTALFIATDQFGQAADTLSLQVTPVPVGSVVITPLQSTINQGETQQLTATVTDSLGVLVTGRTITWTTSNTSAFPVSSTGLVSGIGSGVATIQASTASVPGLPAVVNSQTAQVVVLPTPIATIDVAPTSVTVKAGSSTTVQIIPRDAKGNQLFNRNGNINVSIDNPAIVAADNQGNILGRQVGTAKITYQALDTNGQPQGAATVITVVVN